MVDYMDYGAINNQQAPLISVNENKHTQTYIATHDGADNRLPFMYRSFISFSYGGKNIEDFDLIATIDGNFLQRNLYADFEDNIVTSKIVDGQLFWSSHYKANTLNFTLSTDGITEKQLENFKNWFKPGITRELILSEHPNRAILARVGSVPSYEMLPFGKKITQYVAGVALETNITLYKGSISLSFVMDDPFWYSLNNIIDPTTWVNAQGEISDGTITPDLLKIVAEDHVPLTSMSSQDDIYFGRETDIIPTLNISEFNHQLNPAYFFYGGTAPGKPILTFTLTPALNSTTGYISSPKNRYAQPNSTPYNTIIIESTEQQAFRFTTPSIYTGYNQVISIFNNEGFNGAAWEEIRTAIRDNVKHYAPRAYAMAAIEAVKSDSLAADEPKLSSCIDFMKEMFAGENQTLLPATITINNKTGQVIGEFRYNSLDENSITIITENVGDMVRSNYLKLEEQNVFSEEGYIEKRTDSHPEYGYRIYSDITLTNVSLKYSYDYL